MLGHTFAVERLHEITSSEVCLLFTIPTLLQMDSYWVLTINRRPYKYSLDAMHSTLKETWTTHSSALLLSSNKNRCLATNCPSDPYVKPGMLYFGNSSRETRWVPFHVETHGTQEEEEGTTKKLSEVDQLDVEEVEEYAAEALMAGLVDEREKVVGWARNAYVLFLGEFQRQSLNGVGS